MYPKIHSKLPNANTTIFTIMSTLAAEHNAINLGQGFPDFPMNQALPQLVAKAMADGHNQYVHMNGLPLLRERISEKVKTLYNTDVHPADEITITPGGTYALYTALTTILQPADEVLVFEPAYDCYIPQIELSGAVGIAAEGLKRLRFMALSPDGKLFCTDMYDRSDNKKGSIYIFDKWNERTKKFEKITSYLNGLHNPNQIAFYKNYIYVAETEKLVRYKYFGGDLQPKDNGEVVATFPDYGLSYKYGGWHLTRSITFYNNKLYVSVGSSCNACLEKEDIRATITEMNPDGSDKRIFARGLRNSVAIKWIENELWATTMGRDLIGPDRPEDQFLKIEQNGFYGWPYYFQYKNKIYEDPQFKDSLKPSFVKKPAVGFAGFKAHSAPLGFEYLKDFNDDYLRNSVLVCLHGSTTVSRQRGNAIVRVEGGNKYTEIISGFLTGKTEKDRYGRPCDILMKDRNSFYFTDDLNGVLYYFYKK